MCAFVYSTMKSCHRCYVRQVLSVVMTGSQTTPLEMRAPLASPAALPHWSTLTPLVLCCIQPPSPQPVSRPRPDPSHSLFTMPVYSQISLPAPLRTNPVPPSCLFFRSLPVQYIPQCRSLNLRHDTQVRKVFLTRTYCPVVDS